MELIEYVSILLLITCFWLAYRCDKLEKRINVIEKKLNRSDVK